MSQMLVSYVPEQDMSANSSYSTFTKASLFLKQNMWRWYLREWFQKKIHWS